MKKLLALVLAMLLCCTTLSETVYDYIVKAGYTPVAVNKGSSTSACYYEEKNGKYAITWTEDGSQYRIIDSNSKENMLELYTQILSMKQWQRCQFIIDKKRLYSFNAPKGSLNICGSLEGYKIVLNAYIYGITPPPRPTATPKPTDTPRPTTKPTVKPDPTKKAKKTKTQQGIEQDYVLNTNTRRFHYPNCSDVQKIKDKNRQDVCLSREQIISMGYKSCGHCRP